MSSSRLARSPLSIADQAFTLHQQGPAPLGLAPTELAGPYDLTSIDVAAWRAPCDGVIPLARLREYLCRRGTPALFKQRVWSVLITRAQHHGGAWTLGAVGVALPKLVRLSGALAGQQRRARPELDTEVLAGFLHGLARAHPASAQVFPFLLREAYRAGVAWLRQQRAADALISDDGPGSAPPPPPWGHPDLVLARAVRAGVITAEEAALIGTTRLEDISTETIAAHLGTSAGAVLKRRRRAELRLLAYLTEPTTEHTPAEPAGATDTEIPAGTCQTATRARTSTPRLTRSCTAGLADSVTVHRSACPKSAPDPALYQCGSRVPTVRAAVCATPRHPRVRHACRDTRAGGRRWAR
jgi:DNA-directed RNA polymerase specialized sigma24 family protein